MKHLDNIVDILRYVTNDTPSERVFNILNDSIRTVPRESLTGKRCCARVHPCADLPVPFLGWISLSRITAVHAGNGTVHEEVPRSHATRSRYLARGDIAVDLP